jgi:hypothetical protein
MKLDIYIMATEPISAAYCINLSHKSVCPPVVARQRFVRHVPPPTNTRNSTIFICRVVFYTVLVISKECVWVCVHNFSICAAEAVVWRLPEPSNSSKQ